MASVPRFSLAIVVAIAAALSAAAKAGPPLQLVSRDGRPAAAAKPEAAPGAPAARPAGRAPEAGAVQQRPPPPRAR